MVLHTSLFGNIQGPGSSPGIHTLPRQECVKHISHNSAFFEMTCIIGKFEGFENLKIFEKFEKFEKF